MEDISRQSSSTDGSSIKQKAPNFSRPRPLSSSTQQTGAKPEKMDHGNVHTINAFHEPNRELPAEPRFSEESERTYNTSSENSAGSDFAWDGQTGELVSKKRPKKFDEQRYAPSGISQVRPATSATKASNNSKATSNQTFSLSVPTIQEPSPSSSSKLSHIVKRVSVDQRSERLSKSTEQWEDTASHHTVSDDGDSGSFDAEGQWQASESSTSGLTDAEIRKLQRKGINPALYAEMKAAKKGKKWVGPLLGNTFLS